METKQIKIITSKERGEIRITINGEDQVSPYRFENSQEQEAAEDKAKIAAFNLACGISSENGSCHISQHIF